MPSEILLKEIDLENLDGEAATLIGLEMFLMDVKFKEDIKNEDEADERQKDKMYDSSSGESLYSNEDRKDKDKTTIGDEAIENANKRHRNARKIIEKNQVDDKEDLTTPLV